MTTVIFSGVLIGFGIVVLFWGFSSIFWTIGKKTIKDIIKEINNGNKE